MPKQVSEIRTVFRSERLNTERFPKTENCFGAALFWFGLVWLVLFVVWFGSVLFGFVFGSVLFYRIVRFVRLVEFGSVASVCSVGSV